MIFDIVYHITIILSYLRKIVNPLLRIFKDFTVCASCGGAAECAADGAKTASKAERFRTKKALKTHAFKAF